MLSSSPSLWICNLEIRIKMWEATTTFNLRLNRGERQKKDSKGKRERWRWIAWEWIHTSHFPCCQVVSSISELRYSNEHTILQSSASDLWIQFCHCSCWSFFFVVCVFLDLIFPFVTSCLSLVSWMLKHLSYCSPSLLCMAIRLVIITFLLILLLIQQRTDWEKCANFLSVLLFLCFVM